MLSAACFDHQTCSFPVTKSRKRFGKFSCISELVKYSYHCGTKKSTKSHRSVHPLEWTMSKHDLPRKSEV